MDEIKMFKITVKNGLYVGDLCYALPDNIYYDVWGKQGKFEDGAYKDPDTELEFAMVGTAYGDGYYNSTAGFSFPVDAGIIGISDLGICTKERNSRLGLYLDDVRDEVSISYDNGNITVVYDNNVITIFTGESDYGDDYDDDDYE